MAATSNEVANQAIQIMGDDQPPVTGQYPSFDNSTAGLALQKLYGPCVRTVARQWGWDFARQTVALTLSGNAAPLDWAYEYLYPGVVEVWQLQPGTITDANNPLPQNWSVGNVLVSGAPTKVIWSNLSGAVATYNSNPSEAVWDPLFREAVVRLLASELATAIGGRPDLGQGLVETYGAFESLGEGRPD
jgi:hypothetical protein